MNNRIVETSILAISFVILGLIVRSSLLDMNSIKRTVTVKGFSERLVKADKATWPLTYTVSGNDLVSLYKSVEKKNAIIIKFLKDNGVKESEISVNPPSTVDNEANIYSDDKKPLYRYDMRSSIIVTTGNVDNIRSLVLRQTELFDSGIFIEDGYGYGVDYEFTKLNEIKPQMIEEATVDARHAAEKFAEDSKSKLGKIKYARQGQFSIENRDYNTPYIKMVRVVTTIDYNLKD